MKPVIVMYAKHGCPYCERAAELLTEKEAHFQEIFIDDHPEKREEMIKRSHGAHTVPQIFINEDHIGGCDDLLALEDDDQLDEMLNPEND